MNPYLDGHHDYSRPNNRFLIFGLAAILAIGGLTTRLFYLQIVNGGQFAEIALRIIYRIDANNLNREGVDDSLGYLEDEKNLLLRIRPQVRAAWTDTTASRTLARACYLLGMKGLAGLRVERLHSLPK